MIYEIRWNDKKATIKAENAREAIEKYGSRLVFGRNSMFANLRNWNVDADGYGQAWATASASKSDSSTVRIVARAYTV